jgi:hypothetical protein
LAWEGDVVSVVAVGVMIVVVLPLGIGILTPVDHMVIRCLIITCAGLQAWPSDSTKSTPFKASWPHAPHRQSFVVGVSSGWVVWDRRTPESAQKGGKAGQQSVVVDLAPLPHTPYFLTAALDGTVKVPHTFGVPARIEHFMTNDRSGV